MGDRRLHLERLASLGVDEASLTTFPEEFRQGMAARAEILGTTGANHPEHWVGELANPALHAIVVLFARDVAERERCKQRAQPISLAESAAWTFFPRWIWKPFRPMIEALMNTSVTAIGCRSR